MNRRALITAALHKMSDAAGNNALTDSSDNNVNGASGPNVIKGVVFEGATVHRYSNGGPVPAGTYGGLSATAAASSTMCTSWTIILAPA